MKCTHRVEVFKNLSYPVKLWKSRIWRNLNPGLDSLDLHLHIRCKGKSDFGKIFKAFTRACSFDLLHFLYIYTQTRLPKLSKAFFLGLSALFRYSHLKGRSSPIWENLCKKIFSNLGWNKMVDNPDENVDFSER